MIPPSIQFKVISELFRSYLEEIPVLKGLDVEINSFLSFIEIKFYESEQVITRQFDRENRKLFITGSGTCSIYKYYTERNRVRLANLH